MPMPHRLRKHADYQHAYARSRKQFTKQMMYFYALRLVERRSETAGPRVGLTVPKALGKAHDRNRIKRRLRAVVVANLPLLTAAVDVIVHPRRSVLTMESNVLHREMAMIFRTVQTAAEKAARGGAGAGQAKATSLPAARAAETSKPVRASEPAETSKRAEASEPAARAIAAKP